MGENQKITQFVYYIINQYAFKTNGLNDTNFIVASKKHSATK
jgi:hypothetical protein